MPAWGEVFGLSTPLLELVVRGTVTYLALFTAIRVVGRRESGGLSLTDLLVVVMVVDAASVGLTGEARSIADSAVLVATILLWSVALDAVSYRWPRFAAVAKARPKVLVRDGEFDRRAMRREFMTTEELHSQLRLQGITDPTQVRHAYLEPNGMISVIRRDEARPDGSAQPPGSEPD